MVELGISLPICLKSARWASNTGLYNAQKLNTPANSNSKTPNCYHFQFSRFGLGKYKREITSESVIISYFII